ncbi:hypothetical protein PIB19_22395 [Sphingomonas sp. 7/4-4]|uniref:hypothetical protein n=1 Tax=Sphingomonas sp. 7/4-4 TaxID=3018446 RepID=UPI0022F38F8F|nr:hypothetical protein [Sphingomonas sp. 7/4-4]WBY07958.1 hypothetical protein PIB19_22395 [Sphingomonas sp. 7/4-4]
MTVRSPGATRPWQHVLEPLSGYLRLAEALAEDGARFAQGWNFGPDDTDARSVGWILERIQGLCPELDWHVTGAPGVHEANYLKLDSSLARTQLGWQPRWPLERALEKSVEWHRAWRAGENVQTVCIAQIAEYEAALSHG